MDNMHEIYSFTYGWALINSMCFSVSIVPASIIH